ncbi:MAG: Crp/Fnr family transcriptional regulator [Ruthenibacterium sp.]
MKSEYEWTTLTSSDLYDEKVDAIIASVSTKVVYPAKYSFTLPGQNMDCVYYIKEGRTKHYMDNGDGTAKILYTLTPGWFFGETPFFLGITTGLFSQTETDTVLYRIPNESCRKLMGECEPFRDKMLKCYSLKMLMLRYEIANLTFNSCKDRIKRLFCASVDTEHITDAGWYNLKICYNQTELSEIVGGARVTINRQINELCAEGFLRTINRHIQVNVAEYAKYSTRGKDNTRG